MGVLRRAKQPATRPAPTPAPLPRAAAVPHHWLTIAVVRPGPAAPVPVRDARLVVRPYPRGAEKPEDPVARGSTAADGTFAVSLPPGRYAVYAQHAGEAKAVTVTLEHAGRATVVLESIGRRAMLSLHLTGLHGRPLASASVEVRADPSGALVARAVTDPDGVAQISLPPGAYEVHAAGASARTYLEAETTLRLAAEPVHAPEVPLSGYALRAREAIADAAPLASSDEAPDEAWN